MKLGFGLVTCQRYPGDPRTDADLYREAIEFAVEAERLGFDSVWVSEHHFLDDGYMPSLLPVCAAMAARTSRVEIGTGVLLAPLYANALRLAEDAATVDLISGGRLILGLGLGWREEEFEALGVAKRRLGRGLEEMVAVLREAWSDGVVTTGVPQAVAVTPKPAGPGSPRIWLGAFAEPAVRRAGRIADGFLASRVNPAALAREAAWLREELERARRDPAGFEIGANVAVFAWPDAEEGWRLVRDHLHYVRWKYFDMADARARTGPPPAPPPLDPAEEEELQQGILCGTPEQVAERIRAYEDAVGGGLHFLARLYWPGLEPGIQREAMRVVAEEVAPLLR